MLTVEASRLESTLLEVNHKLTTLADRQRSNEASPLSVFARAEEARTSTERYAQREVNDWNDGLKGSPELYWHRMLLATGMEMEFARLEIDENEYRMRLLNEVEERFRKLIPAHIKNVSIEAPDTSGKMAVALSEAQGKNFEGAMRLLNLEDEETEIRERIERAEIAGANATAATELCEFEARVLSYCASTGTLPKQTSYPESFGIPILEQLEERKHGLQQEIGEVERDLVAFREQLIKAIDASEHPQTTGLAQQLFSNCEKIARKYREERNNGRFTF